MIYGFCLQIGFTNCDLWSNVLISEALAKPCVWPDFRPRRWNLKLVRTLKTTKKQSKFMLNPSKDLNRFADQHFNLFSIPNFYRSGFDWELLRRSPSRAFDWTLDCRWQIEVFNRRSLFWKGIFFSHKKYQSISSSKQIFSGLSRAARQVPSGKALIRFEWFLIKSFETSELCSF